MTWAARLVLERPDEDATELTLTGATLFGRGGPATYVIESPYLSLQHVWVRVQADGVVTVEDVRSENGSFLDGEQVRGIQRFVPGQVLVFGRATLRLIETFEANRP